MATTEPGPATVSASDPMRPEPFEVRHVTGETGDTFTLTLAPVAGAKLRPFAPGQFNMLYVHGIGEVPISISGNPAEPSHILHTVRALRNVLAKRMREKKNIDCELHDILITSGAQQALSFVAFNLLDPGDTYITSAPTYLGALQAFHAYQGNCECIPMNDEGIDSDSFRRNLKRLHRTGITPKFLYAVATFQNPSGECISLEHRKELIEIASEYDFVIIEDDPYGELVFEGESIPSIKSLDTKGRVIYIGTFSKVLAPGFRLAWVIASEEMWQHR